MLAECHRGSEPDWASTDYQWTTSGSGCFHGKYFQIKGTANGSAASGRCFYSNPDPDRYCNRHEGAGNPGDSMAWLTGQGQSMVYPAIGRVPPESGRYATRQAGQFPVYKPHSGNTWSRTPVAPEEIYSAPMPKKTFFFRNQYTQELSGISRPGRCWLWRGWMPSNSL